MEIFIRPIPHHSFEHEMGHCSFWPSAGTEAVSCTYNMGGFTPMTSIIRELNLDSEEFRNRAYMHDGQEFQVIVHVDQRPIVITTTKTPRWESEFDAARQILDAADSQNLQSLCMTHYSFIQGKFPHDAFDQCVRQIVQNKYHSKLKKIIVDVDERHIDMACAVHQQVVEQHKFADRYNVQANYVRLAEAGSPDYQLSLAAELLVKNNIDDRCVHALKWIVLAMHIRSGSEGAIDDKNKTISPILDFLFQVLSEEQRDQAWSWAEEWLTRKFEAHEKNPDIVLVPEFRAILQPAR